MGQSNPKVVLRRLKLDVQLFADPDKTEKATPRRRQKAREEGQISYSKDLATAAVFIGIIVILKFIVPTLYRAIEKMTIFFLSLPNNGEMDDYQTLAGYFSIEAKDLLITIAVLLMAGFAIALMVGLFQTRLLFSLKSLKFDLNKINPINGFKRMFSLRSVVELLKNIGKLALLGIIAWSFITGLWNTLFILPEYSTLESMGMVGDSLYQLGIRVGFALLVLGFVDYFYQRWEFERSIRMSKQEIKDEYKNIEGNPQIKAKQKQMMAELAKRRMMEEVPSATVVVTNPTHYAVALRFDFETMSTPLVVAKGVDYIALRIIEIAKEYDVPIHENPPLARRLYETTDPGEEIPGELFHAVAQVLAFVLKTAGKV
jgi:flagellar biosynthetic protein FlhB